MSVITCHRSPASVLHNTLLLWGRRFDEYRTFTSGLLRATSAVSAAQSKLEADCGVDHRRPDCFCFLIADRNCRAAAQQRVQTIPVAHRTYETERSGWNRAQD